MANVLSILRQKVGGWLTPAQQPLPAQASDAPTHVITNANDPRYWQQESRLPFARYEGAYQWWGERSLLLTGIQDARFDIDPGSRLELLKRGRYWEQNNPLANRLGNLFAQFVVGPTGLRMVPNAGGDEDGEVDNEDAQAWNKAAGRWWGDWCYQPDRASLRTFAELQHIMALRWFYDGEVFLHKTFVKIPSKKDKTKLISIPRVQLIEAHRVGTPTAQKENEGRTIYDGVEVDGAGKPTFYWVRKASDEAVSITGEILPSVYTQQQLGEDWDRIPASNMVHVFEPSRPGQYRGISMLYPVMNLLHDYDDLQFLEMKVAKATAELGVIYVTKTGEATRSQSFRNLRQNIQTQDANGNATTKQNNLWYNITQGGRNVYLKQGEEAKLFESNRPSVVTQAYWEKLESLICAGVGISKLLALPYSNQGTVVRSDLDTNFVFFRSRSAVIARACRDVYTFSVGWAKDYDGALDGAPADWNRVIVRPPRSISVDVGRNSSAALNELEAGTRTFADEYAERGEDWKEQIDQRGKEAAFINKTAEKIQGAPRTDCSPTQTTGGPGRTRLLTVWHPDTVNPSTKSGPG